MTRLRVVPALRPRAILYLRQSVQRDDSISLELQEAAGRDYCERQGYDVLRVEADEGLSGRRWDNRPAVKRVLDLIEQQDADVIVLWKWSRLSRSRKDWALAADRVEVAGGRIESATEPIDTATASGRFARGVMTEYAAFQSEQIGEQWEEVRQRRLRLGLPASGRLPWGWRWGAEGITVDPVIAPLIVEMYRRYCEEGQGSSALARWLNGRGTPGPGGTVWTRQRPFTVLDSPIHAGLIPYRGAEYPGAHAGIITPEQWEQYKALRSIRRAVPGGTRTSRYLLSGLVRCACGMRMQGKGAVTGGHWYGGYICTSMEADHGRNYVSAKRVEPLLLAWLASFADALDAVESPQAPVVEEPGVDELQALWNAEQRRLDRLTTLLVDDVISEPSYRKSRSEIAGRQAVLQKEMTALTARRAPRPDVSGATVREMLAAFEEMPVESRQQIVRRLLGEVIITPGVSLEFRPRWAGGTSSVLDL